VLIQYTLPFASYSHFRLHPLASTTTHAVPLIAQYPLTVDPHTPYTACMTVCYVYVPGWNIKLEIKFIYDANSDRCWITISTVVASGTFRCCSPIWIGWLWKRVWCITVGWMYHQSQTLIHRDVSSLRHALRGQSILWDVMHGLEHTKLERTMMVVTLWTLLGMIRIRLRFLEAMHSMNFSISWPLPLCQRPSSWSILNYKSGYTSD